MYNDFEIAMAMGYNVDVEDIIEILGITEEEFQEMEEEAN